MSDAPEPDRLEGAPHPRDTPRLIGQDAHEAAFLEAYGAERLHHAWLITGPRGVGKATLAWRITRFLLATPMDETGGMFDAPVHTSLGVDPEHPVARRVAAGAEPGLFHIRRSVNDKTGRLRDQIVADDVRALGQFLHLSAADGGRRVVIIDAADEMNTQAANALLKMLEEPPARTTLLLISHQPSGLLPTIRSRCRVLRLAPLGADDMAAALAQAEVALPETRAAQEALAVLADGSVGTAVQMTLQGGLEIYAEIIGLFAQLPQIDRPRALALANAAAGRGAEQKLDLLIALIDLFLARAARTGTTGTPPSPEAAPGEAALLARIAPSVAEARAYADCGADTLARVRRGRAVNLDPAALVLDTVFNIQKTAAG
ncbi:DNA polymerase III subunit delta' [Roseovarius sp. LXJ103]|uniref:DNA polymerase III subunit delta' n=1 Tax=Roseovarius carneus TaxID=2853164 RepID=UPI000D607A74|nr:DNA polymerase III subunit delta' [Roseovarius carneus]MBZ8119737.1 DNA polymerase III subunit delta' [Roseovarius carneus]PWE34657.1 DNA polymerase III subunit delta' [Pelagicola sp. LXJ1103]